MSDNAIMSDPVAFFITWTTYGTWLPGDERGWTEYRHGWRLPCHDLEQRSRASMTGTPCLLSHIERQIVIRQIRETCKYRKWVHYASTCRSNHVHIVIGAFDTNPIKIRTDMKSWCARRLREGSRPERENWWSERGCVRYVWTEESLETVMRYVNEAQDRKDRDVESNPKR